MLIVNVIMLMIMSGVTGYYIGKGKINIVRKANTAEIKMMKEDLNDAINKYNQARKDITF